MDYGEDVKSLLRAAAQTARELGHSYVGSTHLLLALSREDSVPGQLLRGAGMEPEVAWNMAAVLYGMGTPRLPLPQGFSAVAGHILSGAKLEAKYMACSKVGSAHVLLSLLRRAATDKATLPLPAEKPELLDRVMAYMEKNLSEKLTLQEIARQFYVSESTISQLFRKKLGVSFHRCLTQRRLIAAKSLIETGMPLEDVGRQVGFVDYSSFYRAFRQEYGICPRQYRRRHHGEESAEPGRILTEVFGK